MVSKYFTIDSCAFGIHHKISYVFCLGLGHDLLMPRTKLVSHSRELLTAPKLYILNMKEGVVFTWTLKQQLLIELMGVWASKLALPD